MYNVSATSEPSVCKHAFKGSVLKSKASTLADFCFVSFFCSSFGILLFMPSQDKVEEGEKNTEILKMVQVSLKNEVDIL